MAANRSKHEGVPRGGAALLGGLIRCGQCGRRMTVAYHNNGREARYVCSQLATTFGGPRCQSISAQPVDGLLGELILAALAPSAIEVSLQLVEDLALERAERARQWTQRLERARYETTLARRRYESVDPQNRLVARTLERDWEAALTAEQTAQAEHERELAREPPRLQAAEQQVIRRLAEDVPALWHASTTKAVDRQTIARLMLDGVAVRIERDSERVEVCCEWAGGVKTRHELVRTVQRFEQLHEFDELLAQIRRLRAEGCPASVVAEKLNAAGWRPPKRATFNEPMVQRLLFRYGLSTGRPIWATRVSRKPGAEWTLQELAARLGIHRHTAYRWLREARLPARMANRGDQRIWIVQMTEAELQRLKSGRTEPPPPACLHRKPA
jgi:hypothetical protein